MLSLNAVTNMCGSAATQGIPDLTFKQHAM